MLNKIVLFALVVCAFCDAAMIGDFAPMKVGNKWVYSDREKMDIYSYVKEKIIKIISKDQNGDSLFYTIIDSSTCSACVTITNKYKFLEINNSIFIYDTSVKQYVEPTEVFFKIHQLPDSILQRVTFLSQSLYSYSIGNSNCMIPGVWSCSYYQDQWIQNYGLFYSLSGNHSGQMGGGSESELKLVSFNDQPVDSSISTIVHKNPVPSHSGNPLIYADTHSQIHWRGLSGVDYLGVQLYDCRGKLLFSSRQLPGTYILDASQFPSGAYILTYQVNNGIWKHFSFARN